MPTRVVASPPEIFTTRSTEEDSVVPVLDSDFNVDVPMLYRESPPDARLTCSGSAQFVPKGLRYILQRDEQKRSADQSDTSAVVVIVDLRQESHGFLFSNNCVTWQGDKNWGNLGLSRAEAMKDEETRVLNCLDAFCCDNIAQLVRPVCQPPCTSRLECAVSGQMRAETEREIVEASGVRYERLAVPDHCRPQDSEVDRFLEIVRELPPGSHIHVHCRGGKGRTTTFMCMVDMLLHAPDDSFREIINRQAALVPGEPYNLLAQPAAGSWKVTVNAARRKFLENFYKFASVNGLRSDSKMTWSEWVQQTVRSKCTSSEAPPSESLDVPTVIRAAA